ncbi:butyrate kinase [Tissierella pigra]|uniref:Probable butyrate kinase n=1 Tax=Tissierella pigra TaxID=2607614 RepID=A0A6N7XW03_9FIRM|nr:butyrate kinase [Tissierella pigra]MBU5428121.1 butyrate kinase [Tissierella pigra]MSU01977.1 butyrate kinase [Tissierella pigra]
MDYKILVINPGSTTTKIAIYENERELFCETLEHDINELERFQTIQDQFHMRKDMILSFLKDKGYNIEELSAIVGRGGMLPPVKSGAYRVNNIMVDRLKNRPAFEHASNLGALIAYEIASIIDVPSYIYDSVRVDELTDIARISGMPDISRTSTNHVLNSRAMAMKVAKKHGKNYNEITCIVAHLGGGISVNVQKKGKMIDIIADDEGPLSPERAGRVPCKALIDLCYSGKYDERTMHRKLRGSGGLKAYLNTHDAREVEKRIENGDKHAELVYEAMAYQVAKGIGELATVVEGEIDYIILTGGIAYSEMFTNWIIKRVKFIAPVEIMPGENEMESLALGTLRVLRGEEEANEYIE